MNLVDFVVTKILEERKGKVYELYDMTEAEAKEKAKDDKDMERFLFSDGIKQKYEYNCYGNISVSTEVFIVGKDEPYYVGYKGLC